MCTVENFSSDIINRFTETHIFNYIQNRLDLYVVRLLGLGMLAGNIVRKITLTANTGYTIFLKNHNPENPRNRNIFLEFSFIWIPDAGFGS